VGVRELPVLGKGIVIEIGVGEDEVHAIFDVESSGHGFDALGRPKALYEPHLAYRYSGDATRAKLVAAGLAYAKQGQQPYPKESYTRITKARAVDETITLMATSWGLGQVLGSNYKAAGYASPQAMVAAFCDSETAQLEGVIGFIKANHLDDDVRRHDWAGLAKGYNGPAYAKNRYDVKLAAAFRKWQGIKDTPWSPDEPVVPTPAPVTPKLPDAPKAAPAASAPSAPSKPAPSPKPAPQAAAKAPFGPPSATCSPRSSRQSARRPNLMLTKLKGWRTVIANAFMGAVPLVLLLLAYLQTLDVSSVFSPVGVLVYTVLVNVVNIALRYVTTTPVGTQDGYHHGHPRDDPRTVRRHPDVAQQEDRR
jgi:hypothetical protein